MYMKLVQKTLERYPQKPEPMIDLRHVEDLDKRKRMRMLAKMLSRTGFDQRNVLHDPRNGKSDSRTLGRGSSQVFNRLIVNYQGGYTGDHNLSERAIADIRKLQKRKRRKAPLSTPAEDTVDEILPSLLPFGYSSDSDISEIDSDDEDGVDLTKAKRKEIRSGRIVPPREPLDQEFEGQPHPPPGLGAMPARDPSRGSTKFFNYNGKWRRGRFHGAGHLYYATNGQYRGDFAEGRRHGSGVSTFRNGLVYEGSWVKGTASGHGKQTGNSGIVYEGEMRNGYRQGAGKLTFPMGMVYEGEFKHGKCDGHGKVVNKRGSSYVGKWKENMIVGPGILELKGTDQLVGTPIQTMRRPTWPGLNFPRLIRWVHEEKKNKDREHREELRDLYYNVDQRALEDYVAEVREINEMEERQRLEDMAAEKRRELNERRKAAKERREELIAEARAKQYAELSIEASDNEYDSEEDAMND